MGIVLSGGRIITAADDYFADIRIAGEKIVAIGTQIKQPGDKVIDVEGCYLFPGGIDAHTHFDLPAGEIVTADDFATGSKAAIIGGTTTVIDFATQFKGESLAHALARWHTKANKKCYTDYGFHMAITDWNETIPEEMSLLVNNEGISSFKLYMAYKGVLQVDDSVLFQALRHSKKCGALICVHCENGDLVHTLTKDFSHQGQCSPHYHPLAHPITAEQEAVARAVMLAEAAEAPLYIVHLSTEKGLQIVGDARGRGVEVYAETCPQYLLLDERRYELPGFKGAKYVISPPLRPLGNQQPLWHGLRNGNIDTIATDHCAFNFQGQKDLGINDFSKIPNGMPGAETRMGLIYTYGVKQGRLNLNQFVALTSTGPARLFGLFPRKGTLAPGSDADIVVWDPAQTSVICAQSQSQNVDYAPFEGFQQHGKATNVFLRGHHIVQDGVLVEEYPHGIFLIRQPFVTRKVGERCI